MRAEPVDQLEGLVVMKTPALVELEDQLEKQVVMKMLVQVEPEN